MAGRRVIVIWFLGSLEGFGASSPLHLDLQEDGLMTAVKARWPKIQAVTQYKRGEA